MKHNFSKDEAGFTLIETLVALIILTSSLVIMYQIFTDGFRARSRVSVIEQCTEHAERLRDRIKIEAKANASLQAQTGEFSDGYQWTVFLRGSSAEVDGSILIGYDVMVSSANRSGSVTLSSVLWLGADETNR